MIHDYVRHTSLLVCILNQNANERCGHNRLHVDYVEHERLKARKLMLSHDFNRVTPPFEWRWGSKNQILREFDMVF